MRKKKFTEHQLDKDLKKGGAPYFQICKCTYHQGILFIDIDIDWNIEIDKKKTPGGQDWEGEEAPVPRPRHAHTSEVKKEENTEFEV